MKKKKLYDRIIIGLTGGVASGKSTAAEVFRVMGAHSIDADTIAREIVIKGSVVLHKIVKAFGNEILLKSKDLDRIKLKSIIMDNPHKRRLLNTLTHPAIIQRITEEAAKIHRSIVVIDAPLLFEAHIQKMMNIIVVISASQKNQIERIMKRDGITEEEASDLISTQMPLSEKCKRADIVIHNNKTIKHLRVEVMDAYKRIEKGKGSDLL